VLPPQSLERAAGEEATSTVQALPQLTGSATPRPLPTEASSIFPTHRLSTDDIPHEIIDEFHQATVKSNDATAAAASERLVEKLVSIAKRKASAKEDVKYWGGHPQPWRNGTDDSAITDEETIEREEKHKAAAEADDKARAPTPDAHADMLHGRGVSAAFLVLLTMRCDLWEWKTWEVVQFLVKPATEQLTNGQRRCFADIPGLEPFFGLATVFGSHCWGGRWGDLVVAMCAGGSTQRMVWIDIFAVRQWPGNGADLDFRGVIGRSAATMVAVAPPVDGPLTEDGHMNNHKKRDAYLGGGTGGGGGSGGESTNSYYARDAKVLAFCRLWCLVEMFATLQNSKALIFRGAQFKSVGQDGAVLLAGGGGGGGSASASASGDDDETELMVEVLSNCSEIVDVGRAQCAVDADRVREMNKIEQEAANQGGLSFVNRALSAALITGMVSVQAGIVEVDNFLCGEPEGLRKLSLDKVEGAVETVCAAGLVEVLDELLEAGGVQQQQQEEEEEEEEEEE